MLIRHTATLMCLLWVADVHAVGLNPVIVRDGPEGRAQNCLIVVEQPARTTFALSGRASMPCAEDRPDVKLRVCVSRLAPGADTLNSWLPFFRDGACRTEVPQPPGFVVRTHEVSCPAELKIVPTNRSVGQVELGAWVTYAYPIPNLPAEGAISRPLATNCAGV